jgi:CheY-like chemotaxis protein
MKEWGASLARVAEPAAAILVVDDEEDIRSTLQEILASEGYTTAGVSTGVEALEWLRSVTDLPRLILLDLMMPEMDGWEFLSQIDEDPHLHPIPVALMSAHASVKRALDKHRLEIRPTRLLFPKPLNLLRLLGTVRHFCSDATSIHPVAWEPDESDSWSVREAPTARISRIPEK